MKQPTIADLYFSDDYIGTPGVAKGLLEMAAEGDPSYEINKHSDGSESVFYKMDSGLSYYIGTNDKSSDVLVAEVGASKLPPSAYSGEMPQTTMTDTGGGAAIGFRPALPKRPTGGDLEVPMNPFARVIAKGANWFGDQVDKGATLYDTMQLIIPGGFDPDAKMNLPTDFKPRPSQINPATGQMIPATMGFDPKEVTVGEVLKAIPVSEVIGVRGLARLAESLGTGNLPSFGDLLDSAGLWPVGSGTAGVLKATVGTAKNIAKELAPVAGEMAIKSMEKLGTPVQMNIVPPSPSAASAATKAMAPASDIGFYSAVEKAALNVQRNSGSGQAFLNDITKGENVKLDEIKWMGLDDFLKGKKNVTKQEVQDFVTGNRLDVKEIGLSDTALKKKFSVNSPEDQDFYDVVDKNNNVVFTGKEDDADYFIDRSQPKFGSYTLPGGENYREILLTLPTSGEDIQKLNQISMQLHGKPYTEIMGDDMKMAQMRIAVKREYKNQFGESGQTAQERAIYKSYHFDQPNILAHLRVNDRVDADGKKMLLIEEVQSDWHQAGRERGYVNQESKKALEVESKSISAERNSLVAELSEQEKQNGFVSLEGQQRWDKFKEKEDAFKQKSKDFSSQVPDAPFKDTWYQLALKRALRYAADNGYDRVGLTTGKQQAERYDLSKQVDDLNVFRDEDGTFSIKATLMSDQSVKDVGKQIKPEQLSEYVGKDLAEQILQQKSGTKKVYSGDDLKVGGEGMKKYYDDVYPKFLEKYGKRWGASVGETKVNTGIDNLPAGSSVPTMKQEPVRYIDITPEMRKSVQKGQPLAAVSSESTVA